MSSHTTPETSDAAVVLRDGSRATIRPISLSDAPLVARAYERLSQESRRRRFVVSPPHLSDEDLRHLTDVDHRRHDALIAIDGASGDAVGEARYVSLPGQRGSAEVAALIAEDWRGRGLATALLTELTRRARANGIERYVAVVSVDNHVVLEALERLGARHTGTDGDQLELEIELPTEGMPARMRGALHWAARGQLGLLGAVARRLTPWSSR
jgi:RimJ/RimL family protein N-acetyltransferase